MFNLFRSASTRRTIERLYGGIVAQSRHVSFYTRLGVPDTLEGRFEMVVLHTVLVCHRLKAGGEMERALSQDVFDAFLADMDRTLREMGVGDLTVPKRMKKIGEAFYGRAASYDSALAAPDDTALAQALARNILERPLSADFGPAPDAGEGDTPGSVAGEGGPDAVALAHYVRRAVDALSETPLDTLAKGELHLPAPGAPED